jgi:hypothetical protein
VQPEPQRDRLPADETSQCDGQCGHGAPQRRRHRCRGPLRRPVAERREVGDVKPVDLESARVQRVVGRKKKAQADKPKGRGKPREPQARGKWLTASVTDDTPPSSRPPSRRPSAATRVTAGIPLPSRGESDLR